MRWCKHVDGLEFPVRDASMVEKFYCFGLQPWDTQGDNEIHGGIDILAKYNPASTTMIKMPIIAPADACVERIIESISGAGATTLVVVLRMNRYWYIVCNFEPQTTNPDVFEEQRRSIAVSEGQIIKRNSLLGDLVVADIKPGSYPHLHFGFFYKHPDDTLEYIYENYLDIHRSDGTDLAPVSGRGSPWRARDLHQQTTFYCPYVYTNSLARGIYDSKPQMAANGDHCTCICAYGSVEGDCGTCS